MGQWRALLAPTPDGNATSNWGGFTHRALIAASRLPKGVYTKLRLTYHAPSNAGGSLAKAYVGLQATSGDAYDIDGTPIEVTFSSSSGFSIGAGESITSDEVTLTFDGTRNLVISGFTTSGQPHQFGRTDTGEGGAWFLSGDYAATADITGATELSNLGLWFVSKVEAFAEPALYYVIGPSSGWVDPTPAEVRAGTLAGGDAPTASGFEESPTTTAEQIFAAATGLTEDTSYRVAFVWSDGSDSSEVVVSEPFTATDAEEAVLSAAQAVGAFSQAASLAAEAGLSAAQVVGGFVQTASAEAVTSVAASQAVGEFSQSASVAAVVSASAAQAVGPFSQTATIAADASAAAAQSVDAFGQSATLAADAGLSAAQVVGAFGQTATVASDASVAASQVVGEFAQTATAVAVVSASAEQAVGGFDQAASVVVADVASLSAAQAVDAFSQAATAAAYASAQAAQTVDAFGQAAAVTVGSVASLQAAQAVGSFAQAAATTVDLSLQASQAVEGFAQVAQAIVVPVARLSAAQAVAGFDQDAQVDAGEVPAHLEAAQQVGGFTQQATAQALVTAAVGQAIAPFGQEARLITVTVNVSVDQQVGDFGQTAELGALPFVMGRLAARAAVRPSIAGAPRAVPSLRGNRGVR